MALKANELIKLTTAFDKVKTLALEGAAETVANLCEDIYAYADARVPVDTGNLQDSAAYNVAISNVDVQGEVHFGEPGHIGGWENTEAYEYMWQPGPRESNWRGRILYDGWDKVKDRFVPELKDNIKSKLE